MEVSSRSVVRLIIDLFIAAIIGIILLLLNFVAHPFERGFFCNDESIKHPYKDSTISTLAMALVSISVPIIFILAVEAKRYKETKQIKSQYLLGSCRVHPYVWICYDAIGVFIVGVGVTQLFTDIFKNAVGRLRPHFLTVCDPDYNALNCTEFVTDVHACNPNADQHLIEDARKSFISGHTSVSMYGALYLALYIQARLKTRSFSILLKPVIQLIAVCSAIYCGLTRISDYKHHWSDVLSGNLLGITIALIEVFVVSDLFKGPTLHSVHEKLNDMEMNYKKTDVQDGMKNYGAVDSNRTSRTSMPTV